MRMPRRGERHRHRATHVAARASGLALVTATLALVGPALVSPTVAAEGCTTEQTPDPTFPPTIPPDYGCDDTTPPDTTITDMTPAPNDAGFTRTTSVTFQFTQVVSDGDQGPWAFKCKLDDPATTGPQDEVFADCTSPATYSDLKDTADGAQYTFSVYAVDSGDSAITFTGDPFSTADDENPAAPDDDSATPDTRSWKQDSNPPSALIFEGPYDAEGTGWPIATEPRGTYRIDSDENNVDYRCQLDGVTVPCQEGENTFSGIKGGEHQLRVGVKDRAGNEDESPEARQFVMPYNLTEGKKWSRQRAEGYFAGDVLQTKRFGAELTFRARLATDILLLAPSGPTLGKIQVRVGDYRWRTINLGAKGAKKQRRYVVRDEKSLFSGPVRIRSISRGMPVRVDALIFPHG